MTWLNAAHYGSLPKPTWDVCVEDVTYSAARLQDGRAVVLILIITWAYARLTVAYVMFIDSRPVVEIIGAIFTCVVCVFVFLFYKHGVIERCGLKTM